MKIFYNKEGIGDTLLIKLNEADGEREVQVCGDVVSILNEGNKNVAGYNIFNASTYGNISGAGAIELTEEIKTLITKALTENGVNNLPSFEEQSSFVVGYVESIEKHPNADKLNVCVVDTGGDSLQIVCGAANVDQGQRVVVALIGAVMPSGLTIKKTSLRGVESSGMICSAKELGLADAPEEKGILVLDQSYEIGSPFKEK